MRRIVFLAAIVCSVMSCAAIAKGQGIGQTDYYRYQPYHPGYVVQTRPSNYAYGYTYTHPYVHYPSYRSRNYRSGYRNPYGYSYRNPSPVLRYRVTPNRSTSPFGPAHASQYFGNPHASQYLGR